MTKQAQTEKQIKEVNQLASDLEYLQQEFNQKLYGSQPDGDVKLHQIIDYAKENYHTLEMIIEVAKRLGK